MEECGTKGAAQKREVEMREFAPKIIVAKPALGNKTMNMWIPFQVTTESMKDANKTGSKIFGCIHLRK